MLNCGRLLVRVGAQHVIAKELNIGGGRGIKTTFCAVAAASIPEPSTPTKPVSPSHKVDTSVCGFSKDLINAPSTVLEHGVYGEDACFIARFKSTHVAGVADGVGGWRKYGIDPSEFSSALMKNCSDVVRSGNFQPTRPDLIIASAFEKLSVAPRPIGFVFFYPI